MLERNPDKVANEGERGRLLKLDERGNGKLRGGQHLPKFASPLGLKMKKPFDTGHAISLLWLPDSPPELPGHLYGVGLGEPGKGRGEQDPMLVGSEVGIRLRVGVIIPGHRTEFDRAQTSVLGHEDEHGLLLGMILIGATVADKELSVRGLGIVDRAEDRCDRVSGDPAGGEVFALEELPPRGAPVVVVVPNRGPIGGPEFVAGDFIGFGPLEDELRRRVVPDAQGPDAIDLRPWSFVAIHQQVGIGGRELGVAKPRIDPVEFGDLPALDIRGDE